MHEATFVVGMGRKRSDAEGLFHFMQQNQSNEEPVPSQ